MSLNELLVFLFEVFGVVYVTTASALVAPFRIVLRKRFPTSVLLRVFLYCPKCQSFWIGLLLSLRFAPTWKHAVSAAVVALGATAVASPLSAWASEAYAAELEAITFSDKDDDDARRS